MKRAQLSQLVDLGHEDIVHGHTGVGVGRVEPCALVMALVQLGPKRASNEQVQPSHMAHLSQIGPVCVVLQCSE